MNLDFSPEDNAFREEARAFLAQSYPKELREKQARGETLGKEDYLSWHRILAKKGWAAPSWPKEWGGTDWTPTQKYIWSEEQARADTLGILPFGVAMLAPVIYTFGTEEQKAKFLPDIRDGKIWWCQGYSEPGAGSDLASLKTTAVADGDDYVINGSKIWTTYAHWATHMFCLVRTANSGKKQEGISFLLIEMDRPGIDVKPIVSIDGEHHLNQVFLTDVRVPKSNLVGREGQGWDIAKYLLTHERTSIAGVADCKAHLSNLRVAAAERRSGGQPLMEDAAMRLKLARAEIELMALEYTNFRVLAATASGKAPGPESSLLKTMGTAVQQTLAELGVEIAAEQAWPWHDGGEFGSGRHAHAMPHYCFSRAATIYGGSDEVQKNVLAKMLLAGGTR
ncbi:MAG: acyl-CoA dehydrogenase family protein [Phenylobacterium sp.]|nr:acyl-CoA dehydrogenase family protein [Phenylobacterium sp.]